ncbi:MAG: Asp23/Gls24 family envelope stress response protein [Clostridiales bacterium]|nr:Asp23/Gls24 family envelope stress response protein [Clostridiales bacterium]
METEEKNSENVLEGTSIGAVKIANDVVATIAGLAAADVEGIAGMSGGVAGGIAEMLGRKNLTKGVKVEVGESDTTIDIFCIVEYGTSITIVASNVQNKVKSTVENMTGLTVNAVNVHVQGVTFPQGNPKAEKADS